MGKYSPTVSAQMEHVDTSSIDSFPSIPFLPNPLVLDEGGKNISIVTDTQWQQKRDWIEKQ